VEFFLWKSRPGNRRIARRTLRKAGNCRQSPGNDRGFRRMARPAALLSEAEEAGESAGIRASLSGAGSVARASKVLKRFRPRETLRPGGASGRAVCSLLRLPRQAGNRASTVLTGAGAGLGGVVGRTASAPTAFAAVSAAPARPIGSPPLGDEFAPAPRRSEGRSLSGSAVALSSASSSGSVQFGCLLRWILSAPADGKGSRGPPPRPLTIQSATDVAAAGPRVPNGRFLCSCAWALTGTESGAIDAEAQPPARFLRGAVSLAAPFDFLKGSPFSRKL
jgi:hypothetical protein